MEKVNRLKPEDFLAMRVRHNVLPSVEFIVRDSYGCILFGKRTNEPAKNSYFVPGGNRLKGEALDASLRRVSSDELGLELELKDLRLVAMHDHLFDNNFRDDSCGTHYNPIVFDYDLKKEDSVNMTRFKEQHAGGALWIPRRDIETHPEVHKYSKDYFRGSATIQIVDI